MNTYIYRKLFWKLASVFFILMISVGLFSNCESNDKPCYINETFSGEIKTLCEFGECYVVMDTNEYVITADTSFYKLFDEKDSLFLADNNMYKHCDTIQLDTIDFSQYSLLGKYVEGKACDVAFQRDVQIDDRKKEYTYTISMHQCGTCSLVEMSMNWVLVPAIPDDYYIKFVVDSTGTAIDSIYGL